MLKDWEEILEWEEMRRTIGSCGVMDSGMVVSLESLKTDLFYDPGDVIEDEVSFAELWDVQFSVEAVMEQMYKHRRVNKPFGTIGLI